MKENWLRIVLEHSHGEGNGDFTRAGAVTMYSKCLTEEETREMIESVRKIVVPVKAKGSWV